MLALVAAALSWVKDFTRLGLDILEARLPFRIHTFSKSEPSGSPPIFYVSLTNHTKDTPLFVHAVSIRYGNKFYNHGFILMPWKTVEILPKAKFDFFLSHNITECKIERTELTKTPGQFGHPATPSFNDPNNLYRAIINGEKRDSWIEIDFNEFKGRRFRRGRIKREFSAMVAAWPRKVSK
jgi:hypothetical protein